MGTARDPLTGMALALLTGFVLRWTKFGRHVFAIGGNEHAATLTGVPVRPLKVAVYVISALSAGIAGIIQTGWLGAVTTNIGAGMELQVIAAAVIGGANLAGGIGTALGALVGAALIEVIRNSLGLLGINAFWHGAFIGSFIIIAVMFDRIRALIAPFNVALIDCDEGFRLMSRVEDIAPEAVRIGMRVKLRIHRPGGDEPSYPVFVPPETT